MSWNKNTNFASRLDAIRDTLIEFGQEFTITELGKVRGMGLNDDNDRHYLIRKLECDKFVILEQMVKNIDCDINDNLISYKFGINDVPVDWKIEVIVDEDGQEIEDDDKNALGEKREKGEENVFDEDEEDDYNRDFLDY